MRLIILLVVGAVFVAAIAMTIYVAWRPGPPAADRPCAYDSISLDPYPYRPEDGSIFEEPTGLAATATAHAEAYPGNNLYQGIDFGANATQYALFGPQASAYATRCAGLNPDQRRTELALLSADNLTHAPGKTPGAAESPTSTSTSTTTMTPAMGGYPGGPAFETQAVAVVIVTPTPAGIATTTAALAPTTTRTNTPQPTETMAAPAPGLIGHPASAGLRYAANGVLWRIDDVGVPVRIADLPQMGIEPDPAAAHAAMVEGGDLYLLDLATGEQRNLTETFDTQEERVAYWPSRPDTLVRVFYGTLEGQNGVVLQLGTINIDGSEPRSIGVLGDYGRTNFALASDGETLLYIENQVLISYHMSDGSRQEIRLEALGLPEACDALASPGFSPDNLFVAARCLRTRGGGSSEELILILDLQSGAGRLITSNAPADGGLTPNQPNIRWSPSGRELMVMSMSVAPPTQRVIRVEDGALVALLPGQTDLFSPDGQWAVLRGYGPTAPALWFLVDTTTWSVAVPIAVPENAGGLSWP